MLAWDATKIQGNVRIVRDAAILVGVLALLLLPDWAQIWALVQAGRAPW